METEPSYTTFQEIASGQKLGDPHFLEHLHAIRKNMENPCLSSFFVRSTLAELIKTRKKLEFVDGYVLNLAENYNKR